MDRGSWNSRGSRKFQPEKHSGTLEDRNLGILQFLQPAGDFVERKTCPIKTGALDCITELLAFPANAGMYGDKDGVPTQDTWMRAGTGVSITELAISARRELNHYRVAVVDVLVSRIDPDADRQGTLAEVNAVEIKWWLLARLAHPAGSRMHQWLEWGRGGGRILSQTILGSAR